MFGLSVGKVNASEFKECIVSIDYKGNVYLIDSPIIESKENEEYSLKKDIFGLLDEYGEPGNTSWIAQLDAVTQGIYKADIIFHFLEIPYPPESVEYDVKIELKNLKYIPI